MRLGTLLFALTIVLTLWLGSGCAYFNTLYNAEQKYNEGLDVKARSDPEREEISNQEVILYEEAYDKAARVVKHYPESKWVDDALLLMAKASHEKGDYSAALRKYDEILTFFPDSDLIPETFLMQGRSLIEVREYDRAVTALARAAEEDKKEFRGDVIFLRGLVEERRGNLDEAVASYSEVLAHHKKSDYFGQAGLRAGDISLETGDYPGAVSFYERVRSKGRTPLEKYRGGMKKGAALLEMEEWRRARTTYKDVAERTVNEEDRGRAKLMEADAVNASGDVEGAHEIYRRLIEKYPRREAASEAQFAIAKYSDDQGDLETALNEYNLVKEQGTGSEAWLRATIRMNHIQRVLDLRTEIEEEDDVEEASRKRFLLAEQLLEKIGHTDAALAEYKALADDAQGTEWRSRALFAQAWILENRLDQPDSADALLFQLANEDTRSDVAAAARRRHGMAVWKFEEIKAPRVVFIRPEGEGEPAETIVSRVEPRDVPLPDGVTEVQVWVRVNVESDGSVKKARVVKSGGEEFDAAVLEAVNASLFLSPDEGGAEISVIEYRFPPVRKQTESPLDDGEPSAEERDAMLDAQEAPADSGELPPNTEAPPAEAPPDLDLNAPVDSAAVLDPRTTPGVAQPPMLRDRRIGIDN